ncbi:hypothetical protein DXG01_014297 [Tephrocybe rancida]|nr:hypothetical protein DXG01_014297 [Tephrocybe rancida]
MSEQLENPNIAKFLEGLAQQASAEIPLILEYDSECEDMRTWPWPVRSEGIRVTPTELEEGYHAHLFRLPSCFCQNTSGSTESRVFISQSWEHFGEYMVGCAKQKCKYEVALERPYATAGLPTRIYAPCTPEDCPMKRLPVRSKLPFDRKRGTRVVIDRLKPEHIETVSQKLERLSSSVNPGLSASEFQELFSRCKECECFTTKRAFKYHKCLVGNKDSSDMEDIADWGEA